MTSVLHAFLAPARRLKGRVHRWRVARCQNALCRPEARVWLDPEDYEAGLQDPTAYYVRAFQDFFSELPPAVRAHRAYFAKEKRGFGEEAFHTMWWRLIRRYRPQTFLEIGVYRGQTLSLVALIAQLENRPCQVTGISPFTNAGDSVSAYLDDIDYREDTRSNFRHFGLPEPCLVKAFSTDPAARDVIRSQAWDCIYIDGNHDYKIVRADWVACSEAVAPGGLIVLDDAGLSTDYRAPIFATRGHPGPSRLATEIDRDQFREIMQVGHNRVFRKIPQ